MNKRGTGVAFIAIAAFLFSANYISAAIFGSGLKAIDWSVALLLVGETLNVFSSIALIIGIAYIAWGEYEEFKSKKQ